MWWWIRARALIVFAVATALTAGWAAAGPRAEVGLPNAVAQMMVLVPAVFLIPVVPVVCWLRGEERVAGPRERGAVRPLVGYRAGVLGTAVLCVALAAVAGWWWHDGSDGIAATRNLIGYLGVALLLNALWGPRAATLGVVGFPLVCAMFGADGTGLQAWAWPLADAGEWVAAVLAVAFLAAGAFTAAVGPRTRPVG
ncbi:hypothetical protein GCM10027160_33220 [Streptomyces calidiresistens]|uniref:Uncharacterized protein n=1 Tax=Streptomyces calidiresistens TaxID=1485586 RepID=A0A7W3T0V4_9ACTN|nr:hypothetical protein [Streptomyces calidiresistens]MBB0228855.1 hypothetical protein [Streptomyces calidiresistens]